MPQRQISTSGPITIDRTSPVPLYFQLAQHFESAIRSGALKVGARLENEVQLAEMLGLSRPTVRAACLYLANKGLVVRKRGAGTLVANERIDRNVELTSLYDDLGEKYFVAAGLMRELALEPSFHLQVAYKADWHEIGGDAPQFAENPPA